MVKVPLASHQREGGRNRPESQAQGFPPWGNKSRNSGVRLTFRRFPVFPCTEVFHPGSSLLLAVVSLDTAQPISISALELSIQSFLDPISSHGNSSSTDGERTKYDQELNI